MNTPENSQAVVTQGDTFTPNEQDNVEDAGKQRINFRLVVILGAALWGLAFGIVF